MQRFLFPGFDSEEARNSLDPLVILLWWYRTRGHHQRPEIRSRTVPRKLLESSPSNWVSIVRYFGKINVRAVIAKLNPSIYELLSDARHASISDELFSHVANTKNAVFVFEELLSKEQQDQKTSVS